MAHADWMSCLQERAPEPKKEDAEKPVVDHAQTVPGNQSTVIEKTGETTKVEKKKHCIFT